MGAVREAVGAAVDICVEIHRQMMPAESIWLGRRLEQFHPYFMRTPCCRTARRMADVQEQCNIPIATGERFTTIFEYQQLLEAKGGLCAARCLSVRRAQRLQKSGRPWPKPSTSK
ncbi:MAG: enolase C-terminal domain-like protein [Caldilineaceae bacterium]